MSNTTSVHPGEAAVKRLRHLQPRIPNPSLLDRNLVTLATLKDQPDLSESARNERYGSMLDAYNIAAWRMGTCVKACYIGRLPEGRLNANVYPSKVDENSTVLTARFCTITSADGVIFDFTTEPEGEIMWSARHDKLGHGNVAGSSAEITVPPIYAVMALRVISNMIEYVPNNVRWAGAPGTAE